MNVSSLIESLSSFFLINLRLTRQPSHRIKTQMSHDITELRKKPLCSAFSLVVDIILNQPR